MDGTSAADQSSTLDEGFLPDSEKAPASCSQNVTSVADAPHAVVDQSKDSLPQRSGGSSTPDATSLANPLAEETAAPSALPKKRVVKSEFAVLTPDIIQQIADQVSKRKQLELLEILSETESKLYKVRHTTRIGMFSVAGGLVIGVLALVGGLISSGGWLTYAICGSGCVLAAFCVGFGLVTTRGGDLGGDHIVRALRLVTERDSTNKQTNEGRADED